MQRKKKDDTQPKSVQIYIETKVSFRYGIHNVIAIIIPPNHMRMMRRHIRIHCTQLYFIFGGYAVRLKYLSFHVYVCGVRFKRRPNSVEWIFLLFSHLLPFKFISLAEMEAGLCVSFRKSSFSAIFNAIGMHSTKSYSVALLRFVSHTLCVVRRFYSLEFVFYFALLCSLHIFSAEFGFTKARLNHSRYKFFYL